MKKFYNTSEKEKIALFEQFDKDISEKLKMPRGTLVFEKKEFTFDTECLYLGNIKDFKSGYEFICRYFFEKRQQYQRLE